MIITCKTPQMWLKTLKSRYNLSKTRLNDSSEASTMFFLPNWPKDGKSMLIGRYDRTRKFGVVMCRRVQDKWVEFDRRSK